MLKETHYTPSMMFDPPKGIIVIIPLQMPHDSRLALSENIAHIHLFIDMWNIIYETLL